MTETTQSTGAATSTDTAAGPGREPSLRDPITIPGPDPEWGEAFSMQSSGGNPASQGFVWDAARSRDREIAVLLASFDAVAARLRLHTETVLEDLGYVDVATFMVHGVCYTISRFKDDDSHGVELAVAADTLVDDEEALRRLITALGVPPEIVAFRRDGDEFFIDNPQTPLHRFAERVRLALIAAGLPIVPNRTSSRTAAGARIDLDPQDGPTGSVSVSWNAHHKPRPEATDDPHQLTRVAMADAMSRILTAAGFTTVARNGRLVLVEETAEAGGALSGVW